MSIIEGDIEFNDLKRGNIMKMIILLLSLLLYTNVFASPVFCPQTITCLKNTCYGVPQNFYISSAWGRHDPNNTFYFYEADSLEAMQAPYTCRYAADIRMKDSGITITSQIPIKADIKQPENNWFDANANRSWGAVYYCYYNARHCPFKIY